METILTKEIRTELSNFKNAILVYIHKPQVVNRLLFAAIVESHLSYDDLHLESNLKAQEICKTLIDSSCICFRRELLYRDRSDALTIEAVIVAKDFSYCYFIPLSSTNTLRKSSPTFAYGFRWEATRICLNATRGNDITITWLTDVLLPKICRWSMVCCDFSPKTLCHINPRSYHLTYCRLKEKYSKILIENWCESTDSSKFVHEDLGIAAYLINFWKEYDNFGKAFIDVGCGNGLLVYILSLEGFNGVGVDMQKRKIWDIFKEKCTLIEETVFLNDVNYWEKLTPYSWLINNHGDELTPWIPVVASKLGSNFVTIPCCPYTFDGKFTRKIENMSMYESYREFIKDLSLDLCFDVVVDEMRIPSSRSTCIIGTRKTKSACNNSMISLILSKYNVDLNIPLFIDKKRTGKKNEPLRVSVNILIKIFTHLLSSNVAKQSIIYNGECWDMGGSAKFTDIFDILNDEQRRELKGVPGGLKTCLKNATIFDVNPPHVKLKDFTKFSWKKSSKPCLYVYHPKGCPYCTYACPFSHNQSSDIVSP